MCVWADEFVCQALSRREVVMVTQGVDPLQRQLERRLREVVREERVEPGDVGEVVAAGGQRLPAQDDRLRVEREERRGIEFEDRVDLR